MPKNETKTGNVTRLSELRARRRGKRIRNGILVVVAAVFLLLYAMGAFGKSMAMLGDVLESARISFQPGAGFPARTGVSDLIQVESLAGGFVELGKKEAVVFSSAGNQLRTLTHTYARPAITAGNTRFAFYSRSGYELKVESRSRTLYEHTYQQPIFFAEMSKGGSLAVVTGSSRYLAELIVYDIAFEEVYRWYPTEQEGMPTRIAFSVDGKRLAVSSLRSEEGSLSSQIHLLDLRKDEVQQTIQLDGSSVMQLHWLDTHKLLIVCDNKAVVYDMNTAEQVAVYSYQGKQLTSASVSGRNLALLLGADLEKMPAQLVILDAGMQIKAEQTIPSPSYGVVCTRSGAYVLRSRSVAAYDLQGVWQWEMELESQPLAVLDTQKLLVFESGQVQQLEENKEKDSFIG